jgi:hypothetical protein
MGVAVEQEVILLFAPAQVLLYALALGYLSRQGVVCARQRAGPFPDALFQFVTGSLQCSPDPLALPNESGQSHRRYRDDPDERLEQ